MIKLDFLLELPSTADPELKHAHACLKLLTEWEDLAGERGPRATAAGLSAALEKLDSNWEQVSKAQSWCAANATKREDATYLAMRFACTAPDLLYLRLDAAEWLKWLEAGRQLAESGGYPKTHLRILENFGHAHLAASHRSEARAYFEQHLALARTLKESREEGKAFCSLGDLDNREGLYESAEERFRHALRIAQEIGDHQLEADALGNVGNLYDDTGRPEAAREVYLQALELARRIGDHEGEIRHLGNLGILHKYTGELDQAAELFRQQLTLARDLGDVGHESMAMHNLGLVFSQQGHMDEAERIFRQALEQRPDNSLGRAITKGSLGIIYRQRGQTERAIEAFQQWQRIAHENGNLNHEGQALANLGNAWVDVGELSLARAALEKAAEIQRNLGHPRDLGVALVNLGSVEHKLERYDRVLQLNQEAMVLFQRSGYRPGEAIVQANLARVSYQMGSIRDAFERGFQAAETYRQMQDLKWECFDLLSMMATWVQEIENAELQREFEERAEPILRELDDPRARMALEEAGQGEGSVSQPPVRESPADDEPSGSSR